MIKIRTVSYSMPDFSGDKVLNIVGQAARMWDGFAIPVHTQRMVLPPVTDCFVASDFDRIADFCIDSGVRWFNVSIDPWKNNVTEGWQIKELLDRHRNAFCNILCVREKSFSADVLGLSARAIKDVSTINDSGDANFRFGISANIQPNGPFFPFTYSGGELGFSIGLEMTEEVNDICHEYSEYDLVSLREKIIQRLEPQIDSIETMAQRVADQTGMSFHDIDFSLAPLPKKNSSIITVFERLGIEDINSSGMLFATGFLTDMLKSFSKQHKSVGFSGVMFSLLEDTEYGKINNLQGFSVDRMIALSTMCGCGVDMVPINESVTEEAIKTIILEVGGISSRLHKPLGIRLLPVKEKGDGFTHINSDEDFIVNTRIVPVITNPVRFSRGQLNYLTVN